MNTCSSMARAARFAMAALLALWVSRTHAEVLFTQPPLPGFDGLQADASTGPLTQAYAVAPGSVLGAIEWHGYHLPGGFGSASDDFTVLVNGIDVSAGALTKAVVFSAGAFEMVRYTLDIADMPIASGSLELANGPNTQWAWQYGAVAAELQAFTLIGMDGAAVVPEPVGAALWVAGLAGCVGAARCRRRRVAALQRFRAASP